MATNKTLSRMHVFITLRGAAKDAVLRLTPVPSRPTPARPQTLLEQFSSRLDGPVSFEIKRKLIEVLGRAGGHGGGMRRLGKAV